MKSAIIGLGMLAALALSGCDSVGTAGSGGGVGSPTTSAATTTTSASVGGGGASSTSTTTGSGGAGTGTGGSTTTSSSSTTTTGSGGAGGGDLANPCATPGASYLMTFSELVGGTCGPIPQGLVNINPDGTVDVPQGTICQSMSVDGCTAHNSNCAYTTANGYNVVLSNDVTFSQDGSSCSGLETVSITQVGVVGCESTYQVVGIRQAQ